MKRVFLLGLFSMASFAAENAPKLSCLNHKYRISLDDNAELSIASETGKPLLPKIDPRIKRVVVSPMPCAQTIGHATVCFSDICRFERYYDFDGEELTDVSPGGDILFTATPKKTHKGNRLKVHFEIDDWDSGQKYSIDESFETYPGKYCDL